MCLRLAVAAVLVATQGCSCLDDPGNGGTGGGTGGGSAGAGGGSGGAGAFDPDLTAYAAAQSERCLTIFITNSGLDPLSPASLAQARAAYAAGESDIPLSPTGCTRMLVTRDAGMVLREAIIAPPFGVTADGYSSAITTFSYTDAGETMRSDENADGVIDRTHELVIGQRWLSEHVTNDGRFRVTVTPTDAGLAVTEEVWFDGELLSRSRAERPLQQACVENPITPPDPPRPVTWPPVTDCPGTLQMTVETRRNDAVELAGGCLQAMGAGAKAAALYRVGVRSSTAIGCEFGTGVVAWNDTNYWLQTGIGKIVVDQTNFFAGSPGEQTGKMAHELMHFIELHDSDLRDTLDTITDTAKKDRLMALTDRTQACEFACFNPSADLCQLARCADKTVDTSWNLSSCTGTLDSSTISQVESFREHIFTVTRPGTNTSGALAPCNQGKNVGAFCRDRKPDGTGTARFCDTLDECKANCPVPCESLSLSCNKTCR